MKKSFDLGSSIIFKRAFKLFTLKSSTSSKTINLSFFNKVDFINVDLLFDNIDLTYINIYFKIEDLNELVLSKLDNFAKKHKSLFHLDHDLLGDYLSTRTDMKVLRVPVTVSEVKGIPEEFKDFIHINKIVDENLKAVYYVLESLGFYRKEDLLVSELGY